MKKSFIYLFLALSLISINTFAKDLRSPYLDNDNTDVILVSDLKNIYDDSYVTLRGYIVKRLKKDKFLFKDSTGEITLEVDKKINKQLKNVDEKTLVEVYGEFDRETFEKSEIEVKKITIVE